MAEAPAAATHTSPVQCTRCQSGTAPYLPPEQAWDGVSDPKDHRTIAVGEIWGIRESLIVPVYQTLGADYAASLSRPSRISSANSWSLTPSAQEDYIAHRRYHPTRPCMLMEPYNSTDKRCRICLMATCGGTKRREDLTEFLQYFCIPVYPHVLGADDDHLHFIPEWESDCAWLLALPFWSDRPLEKPWRCSVMVGNGRAMFKADAAVIFQIKELCRKHYDVWQSKCARDAYTVPRCLQGYRRFHERANAGRR